MKKEILSPRRLGQLLTVLTLGFLSPLSISCAHATQAHATADTGAAARYAKRLTEFDIYDQRKPVAPGGIVFTGSSSIHIWGSMEKDFPGMGTINRGMGGSQVSDMLELYERLIQRYQPRQVVVYSGTNDLASGESTEQVLRDFEELFDRIHSDFPNARVSFITLAPNPARWGLTDQFRLVNSTVESWTATRPWLDIINVFDRMLGHDGLPLEGIFVEDRLHMNPAGYAIWKDAVAPHLVPAR